MQKYAKKYEKQNNLAVILGWLGFSISCIKLNPTPLPIQSFPFPVLFFLKKTIGFFTFLFSLFPYNSIGFFPFHF